MSGDSGALLLQRIDPVLLSDSALSVTYISGALIN